MEFRNPLVVPGWFWLLCHYYFQSKEKYFGYFLIRLKYFDLCVLRCGKNRLSNPPPGRKLKSTFARHAWKNGPGSGSNLILKLSIAWEIIKANLFSLECPILRSRAGYYDWTMFIEVRWKYRVIQNKADCLKVAWMACCEWWKGCEWWKKMRWKRCEWKKRCEWWKKMRVTKKEVGDEKRCEWW